MPFLIVLIEHSVGGSGQKYHRTMALPKTFKQFSPSVEVAKEFFAIWQKTQDYDYYNNLKGAFDGGSLMERIKALNKAYHCTRPLKHATIEQHIQSIPELDERISKGVNVVDEVANMNGRNMFTLGAMYCHHSNPKTYFGYSRDIHDCLQRLNRRDNFCRKKISDEELRHYVTFESIMRTLLSHYSLESLSNLELDIMLREANKLI